MPIDELTKESEVNPKQAKKVEFSEFTRGGLEVWKPDMGEEKFRRVTGDYSDRPDYTQRTTESWEVEKSDGTRVQRKDLRENWKGGSRTIWVDSDGQVQVVFEDNQVCIETTCTEKAINQETRCRLGRTRESAWTPLIAGEGKFFETADRLFLGADFVENLSVERDDNGQKVAKRVLYAEEDHRIAGAHDKYIKTVVKSENGVVSSGSCEHEIALGVMPRMEVVK